MDIINSLEYIQKFNGVTLSATGDKRVAETARKSILENIELTTEDAYFLNAKNGKVIFHQKLGEYGGKINIPICKENLIALHNHPNSTSFSFKDFVAVNNNIEIEKMIAAGHDGTVYVLGVGNGNRLELSDKDEYCYYEKAWQRMYRDIGGDYEAALKLTKVLGWNFYVK